MLDSAIASKFVTGPEGRLPDWLLAAQLSCEASTVQDAVDDIEEFLTANSKELRQLHKRVIRQPAVIRELSERQLMILLLPTHLHFMRRMRDRLQPLKDKVDGK